MDQQRQEDDPLAVKKLETGTADWDSTPSIVDDRSPGYAVLHMWLASHVSDGIMNIIFRNDNLVNRWMNSGRTLF